MSDAKLYITATPIGNLGDLTHRAEQTLRDVDFIAAEDTRVTAKILSHLGVKKPVVSYYQHNMRERGDLIISRILRGESCALVTDAGTPAVSDPGEVLVRQAMEAGITVVPVPGACAAVAAICTSGLATGRFCFEGFIPVSKQSRRERLDEIKGEKRTLIFYEAPHKLRATLGDLLDALGDRRVTLARELTKLHEEICLTTLSAAVEEYREREPRGEYVLVVEGAPAPKSSPADDDAALLLISAGVGEGLPLKAACKRAAEAAGRRASELYRLSIDAGLGGQGTH